MSDPIQNENSKNLEELKAIQERHQKRKGSVRKKNQEELQNISGRHSEKKAQMKETSQQQLERAQKAMQKDRVVLSEEAQRMKARHTAEMESLQDRQLKQEAELTKKYQSTLHNQKATYGQNLEKARQEETSRIAELRKDGQTTYAEKKSQYDESLAALKEDYQESQKNTIKQTTEQKTKMQKEYAGEIKKLHTTGDKQIGAEKTRTEATLNKIKEDHDAEIEANDKELQKRLATQNAFYRSKLEEQDVEFKKMLTSQRHEFEKMYAENQKRNEATAGHQKALLTQALIDQKRNMIRRFGDPNETSDFKHFKQFDSTITEHDNAITVNVKVPEQDKDTVNVIVKDNQLVLTRQKAFEDEVDNNGRKLTMAANESFREVIPLGQPVMEKAIIKENTADGIKVTIPKTIFKSGV